MQRRLKIIALMIALLTLSIAARVWAVAQDFEYEVETVGGKLNPINFTMVFLVPVLIAIGVFAVMVIAGLIRIKIETDEDKDVQA